MPHPTPYQIADKAESLTGRQNTMAINRAFRKQDESSLWPISGRFNVTERAIRRVRVSFRNYGEYCEGLAYALALEAEISTIVNGDI